STSRARPVSATPTRFNGPSATVLPYGLKKRVDINPQLKGRLTYFNGGRVEASWSVSGALSTRGIEGKPLKLNGKEPTGRLMLSDVSHPSDVVALLLNSRPDLLTDADYPCFLSSPFPERSDAG
ncbi:hypothetical protein, partial [Bradyrhizobium sp. 14AA]